MGGSLLHEDIVTNENQPNINCRWLVAVLFYLFYLFAQCTWSKTKSYSRDAFDVNAITALDVPLINYGKQYVKIP